MVAKSVTAVVEGVPVSPTHQVKNSELAQLLREMQTQGALNGALYFADTKANLDATSPADLDTGFVLDDTTPSLNGVYQYQTDAWVKTSELPAGFTDLVGALAAIDALADIASTGSADDLTEGADTKVMTAAERTKLAGVDDGATANDTDENLLSRANHTGTQAIGTVAGLQAELTSLDSRVNALDAAIVLQGTWDASSGVFPGSGSAQAGHQWIVSDAGTVDAVEFTVGDRILALVDDASDTTFGTDWFKEDYTPQVLSVNNKTGAVNLTKSDVDLSDADNTADADKPVSGPQQTALNAKAGQADLVETDAALDDAALSARLARTGSSGILTGPESVGNELSGAKHPWLHLVQSLVMAISDDAGNVGFGIEDDGAVWLSVLKLLGSLQTETFSLDRFASEHAFALEDAGGNLALAITRIGELLVSGGAKIGGQSDWDFVVVDPNDNVGFGIKDSLLYLPQNVTAAVDAKALDSRNKAQSLALREGIVQSVQLPTADYNTLASDGQSLGEGSETWPSLSKTPVAGALMIGDNVDNLSGADTYDVLGPLQFNALVANTHDGTKNLSGVEEAALTPGNQSKGEPPVIGLTNGLKLALNRRALSENDGRNLVAISPAIAGMTIEQLSKINTHDAVDRYSILTDGVTKVETLAGSDSHVVTAVTWMQGEYNYRDQGASWDKASYKTLMHQLFDDIGADVIAITGQALPPLFMTYQTGATYTRDVDSGGNAGLHVGMAQLEVAKERSDTVMVGPVYPYTDKGGHLDANGARWYGLQQAKVARKVLIEGEPWEPLRPLEVTALGADVFISFHVPVAPLVFDLPYVTSTATDYADNGFRVTSADGATVYPISEVEIVADTVLRLRLASTPPSDALVWYADKTVHDGNGNLRDSDPTKAHEQYEYVPDRGMYAAANIPALVDKNYPLHNWCVAFCLPLNYSEFF